jgi:hypothetical protein
VRCAQKHLENYAPTFVQKILLYAVSPQEPWRLRWDSLILMLVIYSSIMVPYDAAFMPDKPKSTLNTLVDITFYADILLSFWTGYDLGYELVLDKEKIIVNYLSTWFIVDFVATVEWSAVVSTFDEDLGASIGVKLLALIKIFRLARASRLIDRLTANGTMHSGYIEAGKFFMYVVMVGHLLACFFYLWPVLQSGESHENGSMKLGYAECVQDEDISHQVRACIADPLCDTAADGFGWFYLGQCMQGSWRQETSLEKMCLPGTCGAPDQNLVGLDERGQPTLDRRFWFDRLYLAFDWNQYETLDLCPDGTERANMPPRGLNATESHTLLTRCLDTAEHALTTRDPGYSKCPLCTNPRTLYTYSKCFPWNRFVLCRQSTITALSLTCAPRDA